MCHVWIFGRKRTCRDVWILINIVDLYNPDGVTPAPFLVGFDFYAILVSFPVSRISGKSVCWKSAPMHKRWFPIIVYLNEPYSSKLPPYLRVALEYQAQMTGEREKRYNKRFRSLCVDI